VHRCVPSAKHGVSEHDSRAVGAEDGSAVGACVGIDVRPEGAATGDSVVGLVDGGRDCVHPSPVKPGGQGVHVYVPPRL